MKKILVLGLDGLDYHYCSFLMQKGVLPHLCDLKKKGVFKSLKSTEPANSFPAWTSFMTGADPGEHGIFYPLIYQQKNSYKHELVSSLSPKEKNIWQKLSANGISVGIINQPMTFPVFEVNGFMISGRLTPHMDSEFCFPPEMKSELVREFPEYRINVSWNDFLSDGENLIRFLKNIDSRKELSFYLFDKYDPDVKTVIHTETDSVCHKLWNDKKLIDHLYIKMDELVKDYTDRYRDHNIIIISDHGFGSCYATVNINKFLEEKGLLEFKRTKEEKKTFKGIKSRAKKILYAVKVLENLREFRKKNNKRRRSYKGIEEDINFSKTKVFCRDDLGLRVNLEGREPRGIVKEREVPDLYKKLREDILSMEDGLHFNYRIFNDLLKKEEVYTGRFVKYAPDYIFQYRPFYDRCVKANYTKGDIVQSNDQMSGKHTPFGVYFSSEDYEKNISHMEISSIKDIAGLIEALCGSKP